jgi:long-chain fatty acid transport protein
MVGVRDARRRVAGTLLVASAFVPAAAHAGGILLYEVESPDIGYASAGYASRADGPATLLTNPAGMTRLDGIQVQVGTEALYGAHLRARWRSP